MNKKLVIILAIIAVVALIGVMSLYLYKIGLAGKKVNLPREIGIGIIASDDVKIGNYQSFVDYLNKYSDDHWSLVPIKDYGSFIRQMELKQIKAGFMGSAVAYRAFKEGLAVPVARPEKGGISTYYGYILTRKDSGLNSPEDLRDKKFAYVDINTSAGYFFPVYLLKSQGDDPENFFRVASFLGSFDKALQVVLNGDYDGAAVKDSAWREAAKADPAVENDLQIIAQGGPFPDNVFMLSSDFGQAEAEEMQGLLLDMDKTAGGRDVLSKIQADRFIVTGEKDFAETAKIMNP